MLNGTTLLIHNNIDQTQMPIQQPNVRGRQSSPSVLQEGVMPILTGAMSTSSGDASPKPHSTIGSQSSSPGTMGMAREKLKNFFTRNHSNQKSTKSSHKH